MPLQWTRKRLSEQDKVSQLSGGLPVFRTDRLGRREVEASSLVAETTRDLRESEMS